MKKTLTIKKFLATISLSIVIITQHNVMTVQANKSTIKRSISPKTMNESEAAIIKDIKQACLYVASQSISPKDVAAKFGTPAKDPLNANEVEPFNVNLKTVSTDIDFSNKNPLSTNTVHFVPKPGKISIKALKQEFGTYFHNVRTSPFAHDSVKFNTKVVYKGAERDCEIFVKFTRAGADDLLPRGSEIKNENVEQITISFSE